ncbi:DUF6643 family protein [Streptacidiphilus rugosus]|uniref:DUF6643 family protein n=1 Tax=Streptacidiphilus rugosus TaxID=405783 RepID=UPI00055E6A0B|nr:DUF6643 family protein [Streptacidiphilus rugosus]
MTSRSYDGVGYYAPSFASDTPIYDSLVAERGVPQIAPINVPAALPSAYDSFGSSSYGSSYGSPSYGSSFGYGSNLPAAPPAPRLALGPGPSSPSYTPPTPVPAQYPAPQPYIPQQPSYGGQYSAQGGGYNTPANGTPMPPVSPLRPAYPSAPSQYGQSQAPSQGGYTQPPSQYSQQYPQQRGY